MFSQRATVALDEAELKRHAAQFVATRLGLGAEGLVLGADDGSGVRAVAGRARTDEDLAAAIAVYGGV